MGRSQVAQRRQEEGTHIAMVAEWIHSGRPLVAPEGRSPVLRGFYRRGLILIAALRVLTPWDRVTYL